jgi:hypothetical protein
MSEKLHEKVETKHEQLNLHEAEARRKLERLKEAAENQEHDHNLTKIHESIHKEAVSAKEVTVGEHKENGSQQVFGVQRELKEDAYRRTIKKVRSRLNPVERTLSKVIHNRVMEPMSEISSKTVARPSAILGGGLAALVGSGTVLYMAKHYGFEYNFTLFVVLLAGGFAAGLTIEALIRLVRHR